MSVVTDCEQATRDDLERPECGIRLAKPARSAAPHTASARSGMNRYGNQPLATSAHISTDFSPNDAT